MTKVTYDFSTMTNDPITGENVDQNFDDLTAAIDQITTANIATTAGITSTQLSDRYALYAWGPWTIVPHNAGTDMGSITQFAMPSSATTIQKHKVLLKSGRRAYLVRAEIYCNAVSGTSHYPQITIEVGGTTLGTGAQNITAAGYLSIQNTNPVDTPLLPLNNEDVVEIKLGRSGSDATAAGLSVTLWIKEELVP